MPRAAGPLEAPRCTRTVSQPTAVADELDDAETLVVENYFAIVPEWVIDAHISDAAFRLYAVLLRYGQSSGHRMPSRGLLARRLQKRSTDTVDRALKELVGCGAVVVERRRRELESLSNCYHLRSTPPAAKPRGGRTNAVAPTSSGGSRKFAATPSRTDAATPAAPMRPYPEGSTQSTPPPPTPTPSRRGREAGTDRTAELLTALGLPDLGDVVARCCCARRAVGQPVGRWTARVLTDVLAGAVLEDGWPAAAAVPALLQIAGDRETRSPGRLRCAGPWWDMSTSSPQLSFQDSEELVRLEQVLAESDGARVVVQRTARAELAAEGVSVTRLAVARRACRLLGRRAREAS